MKDRFADGSPKEQLLKLLGEHLPPYIDVDIELAVNGGTHIIGVTVSNSGFVNKGQVQQLVDKALAASAIEYTLIWRP